MPVHNHGTEDGPGLTCPERIINGERKGKCMVMIPVEAVEAAAKLIYRTSGRKRVMSYEQARPTCEDEAQLILEAAAPHMFNGAADVVRDKGETNGPTVAMWLRAYGMQSASPIEPAPRLDSKLNPACPDGKWDDL